MNDLELAKVVARIQAADNRQVDQVTIAHWRDMIGDLDYSDCIAAVIMHYRETTVYLAPNHIIENVKRIRADRLKGRELDEDKIEHNPGPFPKNLNAWSAAWDNPQEFARQTAIYHQQCRDVGHDPHIDHKGDPITCYACMGNAKAAA